MPADHGLLDIAGTPVWQLRPKATPILAQLTLKPCLLVLELGHPLREALGQDGGALGLRLVGGDGGQHLVLLLLLIGQKLSVERLGQLGAVAIEGVGLEREPPGEEIGLLAVLDARLVRHVDGLGDRPRNEGLSRGHHADMALDREVPLALAAARRGAVEHRQMLGIEARRAFERHRAAGIFVGGFDLALGEADLGQEVEIGLVDALGRKPKRHR